MELKKMTWLILILGVGILAAVLATGLCLVCKLRESPGSLVLFSDSEGRGFSLRLQESGIRDGVSRSMVGQSWGFFEWPGKRIYGFVSFPEGPGDSRKGKVTSGTGKGSDVELKEHGSGSLVSLVFSGPGLPGGIFQLVRSDGAGLPRLLGFAGRGKLPFRLDHFADSGEGGYSFLDARLRRGKSPLEYAKDLSGRRDGNQGIEERQYWLGLRDRRVSIATERRLSGTKGREESYFSFATLDAAAGTEVSTTDFFAPGWREALAPLVSREAARLLDMNAPARPGKSAGRVDLRIYGLFDETLEPSPDFFLCDSGLGFHYDQYKLAAYSQGEFTFVLPWPEVAAWIR